jgi:hypothetical protein
MYFALDVMRRAGGVVAAAGSVEHRRATLIAGLNLAAVALAAGALHLGGTIVHSGNLGPVARPSPAAIVQAAARAAVPAPRLARATFPAMPDAATLFAQPVAQPTVFLGTQPAGGDASFVLPAAPAPAAPPAARSPEHPVQAVPGVAHAVKLARAAIGTAARAATGEPLVLADAMLDANAEGGVSVSSGVAAGASVASNAGSSIGASVTGAVASVGASVSGVASAVGSAAGVR